VPGVGPKTAAKLLTEFGSVAELYRAIDRVERPKLRQALAEHQSAVELAIKLVTLREDVELDWHEDGLAFQAGAPSEQQRTELVAIFRELGFHRFVEALGPALPGLGGETAPAAHQPSSPAAATQQPSSHEAAEPAQGPAGSATASGASGVAPEHRSYRCIESSAELREVCADARRSGRLAVMAFGSEPEAMRAALVGIALATGGSEPIAYVPVSHLVLGGSPGLGLAQTRAELEAVFADPTIAKLGHDLKYSAVLLERHGMRLRGGAFDTMIASYLFDPETTHELAKLAERDALLSLSALPQAAAAGRGKGALPLEQRSAQEVCPFAAAQADAVMRLEQCYRPALEREGLGPLLSELEMPLLGVLTDMELRGVLVEPERLAPIGRAMVDELATLEKAAYEAAGQSFNLASPKQLETILYDELKLKPTRKTKTGRSTDAEALEAIADEHPLPRIVLEHRAIAKLKGTYVDTLPKLILPATGRIHTTWDQAGTATGRIASKDPNLQNIPVRTAYGKRIREAFAAPQGSLLLSADYSQIELRVLAHLSRDPVLVSAFASGEDVHVRTAMEIFAVSAAEVTDTMRRQSKTINFGIIYGMGPVALAKRLGIPRPEASRFIDAYLERYQGVREFMDRTLAQAKERKVVHTVLGRLRKLPDIDSSNHQRRAYAERIAQNTPIQGTAADLLKLAMVRLAQPVVPGARMVLTVHDELVFEVPAALIEEAKVKTKAAMESVYPLDVPLVVDVGTGANWAEAH